MRTIEINGKAYLAGTARVEPDLNCLPGRYIVVMRQTTWMQAILQRFQTLTKAREYADELNSR